MSEIKSVCWNITSGCNEDCQFCYRVDDCKDLSYEENLIILENLVKSNVKKISLCGGEPLLYDRLLDLMKEIKKRKPEIILSMTTNGILLSKKKLTEICPYLDWLSLNLDSIDQSIESKITRNKNHIKNTSEILKFIEENKVKTNIKINTVVSKYNLDKVDEIAEYINGFSSIKRWKLMKFYPIRGLALKNKDLFDITEGEFVNSIEKVQDKKLDFCKISISNGLSMSQSYFSIYPDGHIRVEKDGEEICVGNALKDSIDQLYDVYIKEKKLHESRFQNLIMV